MYPLQIPGNDFFNFLRMRSMFDPQNMAPSHDIQTPQFNPDIVAPTGTVPDNLPGQQLNKYDLYNPEVDDNSNDTSDNNSDVSGLDLGSIYDRYKGSHDLSDQYKQLLAERPVEKEPGIGKKILATIAGGLAGGNIEGNVNAMLHGKYDSDLAEWNKHVDLLRQGVSEENTQNTNERLLANADMNQQLNNMKVQQNAKKLKDQADYNQGRLDNAVKRIGIAQQNADTNLLKANVYQQVAKGGSFHVDAKGNGWMVYKDGTATQVPNFQSLPEKDKIELQNEGKAEILSIEQKNALQRLGIQHENRLSEIDETAAKKVTSGNEGTTTTSTVVTPPKEPTLGQKIMNKLGVSDLPKPTTKTTTTVRTPNKGGSTTPNKPTTPQYPAGTRIKVIDPSGKTGTIPAEQLQDALKQGYKVVGG